MRVRGAVLHVLAAGLIVLAAGCGGKAPLNNTSLAQSRLAEAETRAAALVKSGDFSGAARHYGEALRIATSLENADAIAANAINLSIVQQWLGRDADARAALGAVLDDPRTAFSDRRKLQAELRRAILELAGGNIGAAAIWAGQAERRCTATNCEYAATILNVRAQVELDSGHGAEAARLAQAAAERSRGGASRAESANALRTLGRARLAQGQPAAALEPLRQALELDREIGDPRKILADLAELARAAEAAGDAAAARDYRERSLAVSKAMNGARGSAEAVLVR
ncbi:MAG TPA: tetratricopeptide repeat protein [Burkholderiales bacterium]|nr:tetratricopeptide repeat protein [Burkholderiales bacterium]